MNDIMNNKTNLNIRLIRYYDFVVKEYNIELSYIYFNDKNYTDLHLYFNSNDKWIEIYSNTTKKNNYDLIINGHIFTCRPDEYDNIVYTLNGVELFDIKSLNALKESTFNAKPTFVLDEIKRILFSKIIEII